MALYALWEPLVKFGTRLPVSWCLRICLHYENILVIFGARLQSLGAGHCCVVKKLVFSETDVRAASTIFDKDCQAWLCILVWGYTEHWRSVPTPWAFQDSVKFCYVWFIQFNFQQIRRLMRYVPPVYSSRNVSQTSNNRRTVFFQILSTVKINVAE